MSILSNWLAKATPSFFSSASAPTPEPKKILHIELVEPKDWPKVELKAKKWIWTAYQKAAKQPPKSQAYAQLIASGYICQCIESHLKDTSLERQGSSETIKRNTDRFGPSELYICKDSVGKIHGIATATKNRSSLSGDLLATHPRNIPCKGEPNNSRSVKGVGTAFIKYAERIGPERGIKNILLENTDASIKFYQKKGFRTIRKTFGTAHPFTLYKPIQPTPKL